MKERIIKNTIKEKNNKERILSYICPDLLKEWDYEKNSKIGLCPNKITYGSNKKAYWICKKNGHKWEAAVNSRSRGINCPYCSGQKACKDNCLYTLSPELCKEWNYRKNKNITPENVTCGSIKKVWWICFKGHEWEAVIENRVNGTGCPCCSGHKLYYGNCLGVRYPEISKEWNFLKNGGLTPKDIMPGARRKVWWMCSVDNRHQWKISPNNRTNRGSGCPFCKMKGEGQVGDLLLKYFSKWEVTPQKKIWEKYKNYEAKRLCDFWMEKDDIKIMVEHDGEQHFEPVRFGGISLKKAKSNFKKLKLKDKLDAQFCKENNILLYRIKYDEDKEKSIIGLLKRINCERI